MNNQTGYTSDRGPDRAFIEFVLILMLVAFFLLSCVLYFFYREISSLIDQTNMLTARLEQFEKGVDLTSSVDRKGIMSADDRAFQTTKLIEDPETATSKKQKTPTAANTRIISPRSVEIVIVEPNVNLFDWTLLGKSGDEKVRRNNRQPGETVVTKTFDDGSPATYSWVPDKTEGFKRKQFTSSSSSRVSDEPVHERTYGELHAQLVGCRSSDAFTYCDVRLRNQGKRILSFELSTEKSFARAKDGRVFRANSFTFDYTDNPPEYRAATWVKPDAPISVRYRFYNLPGDVEVFDEIQFNIFDAKLRFTKIAAR